VIDEAASRGYRRELVELLRGDGRLRSRRVAAAIEAVPRELFVPGVPLDEVYRPSDAIVTKRIDGVSVSSASAPEVVALMLEQLDPQRGDRVLEIGAGTGYNAALLAYLVGETGRVVTLDIDEDLVLGARAHLLEAGYGEVTVVQSDGALGYPTQGEHAYDRIMLTVASSDIAPAWHEQLARPHGRLVMPLAVHGLQRCVVFTPDADHLVCRSPRGCSFIGLRGLLDSGGQHLVLDPDGERAPTHALRTAVSASAEQVRKGLHLWLAAHEPGMCSLLAWAEAAARSGELLVLVPSGAEALAEGAVALVKEWDARGRPTDADAVIRAYPRSARSQPTDADEVIVDERWTRFILSWRAQPPATFTV
jgi:protein-L-isoaspartate(D-aspartate) O-methyltransferase